MINKIKAEKTVTEGIIAVANHILTNEGIEAYRKELKKQYIEKEKCLKWAEELRDNLKIKCCQDIYIEQDEDFDLECICGKNENVCPNCRAIDKTFNGEKE